MSDFKLLEALQQELISTLQERKSNKGWLPNSCSKAKIHRLRLQIQEVMLRIERKCMTTYKLDDEREGWE